MDLFHFTMQQLAPSPLQFREGDSQTVRAYLHHWLHRYHHPDAPRQPPAVPSQGNQLTLDASGWHKLAADTADFYGLSFSVEDFRHFSTMKEVETYVHRQLCQSAVGVR